MTNELNQIYTWYSNPNDTKVNNTIHCQSRDVFTARQSHFLNELIQSKIEINRASLFSSVIAEIGINSFDHNIGKWQDTPGCSFFHTLQNKIKIACIADRGQGFLNSLQNINPSIIDDNNAIHTAFEKIISGRFPERRGNGLKFVKRIINSDTDKGLYCRSGNGKITFGGLSHYLLDLENKCIFKNNGQGVFTIIAWSI